MTAPQPFGLLDTTDFTVEQFDTLAAMLAARGACVARGHDCITFQRQGGTYWIDGMSLAQIEKVAKALAKIDTLPATAYLPPKP